MEFNRVISIGSHNVGWGNPPFIIAEAGVAHFGDFNKALKLIDLAVDGLADAVKFQTFKPDEMISSESPDWKERMKSRALRLKDFVELKAYADHKGILFSSTAHDEPSFDFLTSLDLPFYKIGSGEVGNWPYIKNVAMQNKPVILSTGMYSDEDIASVIDIFRGAGNPNLVVLHCITDYPCPPDKIGLGEIARIREQHSVCTGYSDHSVGYHIPIAAAALGASVIEKHISLDFNVPDAQDWKVSCGTHDLKQFVTSAREAFAALGQLQSRTNAEVSNSVWATKSLVAKHPLSSGAAITHEDLVSKRPGTGISPRFIEQVVGKVLNQPVKADEVITWTHLSDA